MERKKQLVLPVAGFGTRMGKRSQDMDMPPKALIPLFDHYNPGGFYNTYLLNHLQLAQSVYEGVIIVIGKQLPEDVKKLPPEIKGKVDPISYNSKQKKMKEYVERFYDARPGSIEVLFAEQDMISTRGTLGSLLAAKPLIHGDVNMVMVDDLHHKYNYVSMAEAQQDAILVGEVNNPAPFGLLKVDYEAQPPKVVKIIEKPRDVALGPWVKRRERDPRTGKDMCVFDINLGGANLTKATIDRLVDSDLKTIGMNPERKEYELTDLYSRIIADGGLSTIPSTMFFPIGTKREVWRSMVILADDDEAQTYVLSYGTLKHMPRDVPMDDLILEMVKFLQ